MHIICVGLNHRSTGVDQREKFSVADNDLAEASALLGEMDGISESVILSTCNRVELYAATQNPVRGFNSLHRFLAGRAFKHEYDAGIFYEYHTPRSISHLFRVVSGLDSMVLGETEILGQVKKAYSAASQNGSTARHLNKLFQRAFSVAKEVRTNSRISRGRASVGSATVDLAGKVFGDRLAESKVLILGSGETGEMVLRTFRSRGIRNVTVSNRSIESALKLASSLGADVVPFAGWERRLQDMDIVITSTSATEQMLLKRSLSPIMGNRMGRPLFIVDLAVPRNVDPTVNELEDVYLFDIDSIKGIADEAAHVRRRELSICEEMIESHVVAYLKWLDRELTHTRTQTLNLTDFGQLQSVGA